MAYIKLSLDILTVQVPMCLDFISLSFCLGSYLFNFPIWLVSSDYRLLIFIWCLLKHVNYYICIDTCLSQIIATDLRVKTQSTLQTLTMTVNFFFTMLLLSLFFSPTTLCQISNGNFSQVTLAQLWIIPRRKEILT